MRRDFSAEELSLHRARGCPHRRPQRRPWAARMPLSLLCEQPVVGVEIEVFVPSARSAPSAFGSTATALLGGGAFGGAFGSGAGQPGGAAAQQADEEKEVRRSFAARMRNVRSVPTSVHACRAGRSGVVARGRVVDRHGGQQARGHLRHLRRRRSPDAGGGGVTRRPRPAALRPLLLAQVLPRQLAPAPRPPGVGPRQRGRRTSSRTSSRRRSAGWRRRPRSQPGLSGRGRRWRWSRATVRASAGGCGGNNNTARGPWQGGALHPSRGGYRLAAAGAVWCRDPGN